MARLSHALALSLFACQETTDAVFDAVHIDGAPAIDAVAGRRFAALELGTLGGRHSRVADMDDAGRIVGWSETEAGQTHAFLWQDGVMVDLGISISDTSRAVDMNERGEVLISQTVEGFFAGVYVWRDGEAIRIGDNAWPVLLGDSGIAVGARHIPGPPGDPLAYEEHVILWDGLGEHDLGAFGHERAGPAGLGEGGELLVVACESSISDCHGYVVTSAGITEVLDPTGEPIGGGVAMNALGRVVAEGRTGQTFLWDAGMASPIDGVTDVRPYAMNAAGDVLLFGTNGSVQLRGGSLSELEGAGLAEWISATAMNEAGLAVGQLCNHCEVPGRAAFWEGGRLTFLDEDPGLRGVAQVINAGGLIAGDRYVESPDVFQPGLDRFAAVLWMPLE